ncbi:hypothetical protein [Botryobacter ruber]|uniref:hypothetical protein n=1 Tax=Botryobacter ruber TaxID=2171629 RepID=UPI000E0BA6F6|nr:hypothetical protein [Botryobacter ruber]
MGKIREIILLVLFLATLGVACNYPTEQQETAQTTETQNDCQPLETREANVPAQTPAFPGQTRACAITTEGAFRGRYWRRGCMSRMANFGRLLQALNLLLYLTEGVALFTTVANLVGEAP